MCPSLCPSLGPNPSSSPNSSYSRAQQPQPDADLPDHDALLQQLRKAKGACGLDGWTAEEVRILADHMPALPRQLHQLWVHTAAWASHLGPNTEESRLLADDLFFFHFARLASPSGLPTPPAQSPLAACSPAAG